MRDIPTRLLILLMAMTLVIAVVPAAFAAEPVRMGVDGGAPAEYASLEDAFAKLETDTPTASARILVSGSGETVTPRIFKGFDLSILSMDDQRIELKLAPLSFANGTLSIQAADAFMAPQADTSWTLRIGDSSSQDTTVVLDDADLTLDGGGTTTNFAIQIYGATGGTNTLDITNGSNLVVTGYKSNTNPGNAIYTHSKATDIINVTDSTYNAYGNRSGYIAAGLVYVNVTRGEFNVVDNSGNGSNGGIFTAVDSKIDFSRNGSHGLSVTSLHLERSELVAEENGYTGVWVNTAGATIIDSTMAVNRNRVQLDTLGAFNLMGGDNTIDAKSRIDILENLGTGLRLNAGTLTVADGAQLTVMDNTATFGGGVEVNAGEMILPTTAIIYNNTGIDHADDIFVNDGAQLTLHPVLDGWILNEAPNENHVIDGWYDDAVDTRWSAHSDPIHIDEYTEFAAPVAGPLSLKAAHTVWIDLAGTKVWEGGAAPRPTITVRVTVDGEPVVNRFGAVVAPISLESNETTFAFTDLPKFTVDGDEIAYAVTEDMVDGYTSVLTREGTDITVTNTFVEPEKPVDPVTPITPGKPVDPVTPGKPVDPMTPITPDAPRTVKMGSTVNPKTGDHNPALIVTIMILVSAAAIFCLGFAPRRKSTH